MRYLVLLALLLGCAHRDMNIKQAMKMCRKIYGPQQALPKPMPKALAEAQEEILNLIGDCYREHVERTRDPRDYVSCAMVTYRPKEKARLTVLSNQELLPPEIMLQCISQRFQKIKDHPKVKKTQRLEFVFHHIAVTKG